MKKHDFQQLLGFKLAHGETAVKLDLISSLAIWFPLPSVYWGYNTACDVAAGPQIKTRHKNIFLWFKM